MDFIKKNLNKILICAGIVFAVVAIIMLVAPGITPKSEYKNVPGITSYTMAQITFGHKMIHPLLGAEVEVFKFAVGNLFTYIFIVAGMVCAAVAFFGKGGKIMNYVAAGLLLVGGVLYFCAGKLLVLNGEDSGTMTIGIGSIIGGIFSILAAAAVLTPAFLKIAE